MADFAFENLKLLKESYYKINDCYCYSLNTYEPSEKLYLTKTKNTKKKQNITGLLLIGSGAKQY